MGRQVEALSTFRFDQSAYLMVSSGDTWVVTIDNEPTSLVRVLPRPVDCCFDDLERSGTSLWLHGGNTGLVQVQLGQ